MKQKLKKIKFVVLFLCSTAIFSQSNYYYYKGKQQKLVEEKKYVNLFVDNTFNAASITNLNVKEFKLLDTKLKANEKFARLEFVNEPNDIEYLQKVNALKNTNGVTGVAKFYKTSDTKSVGTSNLFYIKLSTLSDTTKLKQLALEKNVTVLYQNKFMPLWFALYRKSNTIETTVELTNIFFETNLFESIDPAFMLDYTFDPVSDTSNQNPVSTIPPVVPCSNDPLLGQQWNLPKIKACEAFAISQGTGVKVAVIDTGLQLDHIDLAANIAPLSYDTESSLTNPQPSIIDSTSPFFQHGTHVGGIIGAARNNGIQITGVAPQCKLISVSTKLAITPSLSEQLANGISWSWQVGNAEVINNSWGVSTQNTSNYGFFYSDLLNNAIADALNSGRHRLGCVVVFASGNNGSSVFYPANENPNVLAVGAVSSNNNRRASSSYGSQLDIVAPGEDIYSTTPNNGFLKDSGTSAAAPHVAGVAALILALNPCFTGAQVRNIIESTARKNITPLQGNPYNYSTTTNRTNGTWNVEMGYGIVDALAAVQMAQQTQNANIDLFVKDSPADIGEEPNTITTAFWESQAMWIRNTDDNGTTHQNPNYHSDGTPNYLYVKVDNRGCSPSTPNFVLKTYWAKASTGLDYPNPWNGGVFFNNNSNQLLGNVIGSLPIPVVNSGETVIIKFPWAVPDPNVYSNIPEPWHFCLLSRIEGLVPELPSSPDPIGIVEYVQNSNNVAWKNITIVNNETNVVPGEAPSFNASVAIANPFNTPRAFYLEIEKDLLEPGKPIYDAAEITLKMDETLFNAWQRGGKQGQLLQPTASEKQKIVEGNHVLVNNIAFEANEVGILNLKFNFLTDQLTPKTKYLYRVIQKDALTNKVIGGETFEINNQARVAFDAAAGADVVVNRNEAVTLSAVQINEAAVYNWYNEQNTLVFTGKDLTVTADAAKKYKLEVIATADGFKDYDEVQVTFKPDTLSTIIPNPASDTIKVNYKINTATTANLMVVGSYGTTNALNTYSLNVEASEININTTNYAAGLYTVALVCNGQIVAVKTLIKN